MRIPIALSISIIGLTSGGVLASSGKTVVRVPVLNECATEVKKRIENIPKRASSVLIAKYISFDGKLETHPTLVGYLELSSSKYGKKHLTGIANGYITSCLIDMTIAFKKNDPADIGLMVRYMSAAKNKGAKLIYLVDESENIRILYRKKK